MRKTLESVGHRAMRAIDGRSVPTHLRTNWRAIPQHGDDEWDRRLGRFRTEVVPWLDATRPLEGRSILEIGCGYGASTVALCEQGAAVVAVDVDNDALDVARARSQVIEITADFRCLDASTLATATLPPIDWVIFWASLEHMTFDERSAALSGAWSALPSGGLLTLVETPNRLWPFDSHTSKLPFFSWLPDDLAFAYAKFSPRDGFGGDTYTSADEQMHHFLRRGRGVSFHEFDLAIGPHDDLRVESALQVHRRRRNPMRRAAWAASSSGSIERSLRRLSPTTDRAWFQPFLYLTLSKP